VVRKVTRLIHVINVSNWDLGFSVFGVAGRATRLTNAECPNYLFLCIPLKVEIKEQVEETQELLEILLAEVGQHREKETQDLIPSPDQDDPIRRCKPV
jgi:hypothetical protein